MSRMNKIGWLVWLWVATVFGAAPSEAHNIGESYLYFQVYEDRLTGRFEIALADLNPGLGLSGTDLEVSPSTLDQHVEFLQNYYRERVTIADAAGELSIRFTEHRILDVNGGYVLLSFEFEELSRVPEEVDIRYSILFDEEPSHRGFALIEYHWNAGIFANENQVSLVFSPSSRRQQLDLVDPSRWTGIVAIVRLGIEHIWEGIDHILFLVALLLPAVLYREEGGWRPVPEFRPAFIHVVKIVTAFTVAHSVTLSASALGLIHLPGKLVEVVIAGSIAIAAADLLVPIFGRRVWLVVIGFGLFHGFGFAGALSEMGVLNEHIGLSLLAFNLGVEIGQLVIVAILVPLLFFCRQLELYRRLVVPAAAVGMIVISLGWVIERAFEVDIPMSETLFSIVE